MEKIEKFRLASNIKDLSLEHWKMKETSYFNSVFHFKNIIPFNFSISSKIVKMRSGHSGTENGNCGEVEISIWDRNLHSAVWRMERKGYFNSVFRVRIKVSCSFSFCRQIVKVHICIVYSGECFAPICARVSRRHEYSVISSISLWQCQILIEFWYFRNFYAPWQATSNCGDLERFSAQNLDINSQL